MFCEWEHEIRVEERLAAAPGKRYLRCVGGAGACPPEDIGGPDACSALPRYSGAATAPLTVYYDGWLDLSLHLWRELGGGSVASKQLSRLLRRDGSLCGVHHAGCGQRINSNKEGSVDHIFPQAFFRQRETGVKRAQFNEDWNCQPMHKKCNNVRKGQVWGFPVFLCTCHWLQVEPNDAGGFRLCVYWQCETHAVPSRHEVDPACDFVFPDPPVEERGLEVGKNVGAFIGGSGTMGIAKQGITGEGHDGHMFPRLRPSEVLVFNSMELLRVLSQRAAERVPESSTIAVYNKRMIPMKVFYTTGDGK